MKFLADEGIDRALVLALRNLGYETEYVAETMFAAEDFALINHAFSNKQVIITKDKDFGELVFKHRLPTFGIVLLRLEDMTSSQRVDLSLKWFRQLHWDFEKKFTSLTQFHAREIDLS